MTTTLMPAEMLNWWAMSSASSNNFCSVVRWYRRWSEATPSAFNVPRVTVMVGIGQGPLSLRADDRPLGRQRDTALCVSQRLSEIGIAEKADIGLCERRFRNNQHAPKASPCIDEKDLGVIINRGEVDTGTVAKLSPQKFTQEL
jgi:hypothetical protein